MTTTPQAALLSESEIVVCIAKAGCIGTVKMSYESGPYDIYRPSINASRLYDAIEAAILAKLQSTQEPVQAGELPPPFGYVSDGFPDGLHFQHKPWPEMHMLLNSVAQVYSAAQMRASLSARKPLKDEQIVASLKACEKEDHTKEGWIWRTRIKWARAIERAHGIGLEVKP